MEVDLATCVATTIKIKTMSTFNVFMHAALMIGAWMWLIPSGNLTAVYKPHFGPGWIKLHMPLQYSAVACALCAFFIMVISVEVPPHIPYGPRPDPAHARAAQPSPSPTVTHRPTPAPTPGPSLPPTAAPSLRPTLLSP